MKSMMCFKFRRVNKIAALILCSFALVTPSHAAQAVDEYEGCLQQALKDGNDTQTLA
jgi:hypothetical protein